MKKKIVFCFFWHLLERWKYATLFGSLDIRVDAIFTFTLSKFAESAEDDQNPDPKLSNVILITRAFCCHVASMMLLWGSCSMCSEVCVPLVGPLRSYKSALSLHWTLIRGPHQHRFVREFFLGDTLPVCPLLKGC